MSASKTKSSIKLSKSSKRLAIKMSKLKEARQAAGRQRMNKGEVIKLKK